MQKNFLLGMLGTSLVLFFTVFNRDTFNESYDPDYYMFPVHTGKGTVYRRVEAENFDQGRKNLPTHQDTFLVIAMKEGYFNLTKLSYFGVMQPITYTSKVNFCRLQKNTFLIFSDLGTLNVISAENDTLVHEKRNLNWLPDKIKIAGQDVYLANDTVQIQLKKYKN